VRTATALYVRYAGGFQEYYDTATDPYELHNRAGQGVPADLRNALRDLENCHTGATCRAAARLGPPAAKPVLGNEFIRTKAPAGAALAPNVPRASGGPG
jgi:hypothetical protein